MAIDGKVFKYGNDVDTDVIIPARYLNDSSESALACHCMEDLDAQFTKNVRRGDVIVAGDNFGCGSSREHAPLAIKASGISLVIANSFARIFYRNAINIGLPIMECPQAVSALKAGDRVKADLTKGEIHNLTTGEKFKAQPFPPFVREIIDDGGLLAHLAKINDLPHNMPQPTAKGQDMNYNITVLDGDGIGPEICAGAIKVLNAVGQKFGHKFNFTHKLIGGCAIDADGTPLPDDTIKSCLESDSVLLGAVGGYKWDNMPVDLRPEKGLLGIRKAMGLYSNIRPAKLWASLAEASPLKRRLVENGVEIIIVRELTGGIYFGERGRGGEGAAQFAWDTEKYSVGEIERITRIACELAMKRNKKIVSVDKANVLESSRLWRRTVHAYAEKHYPEVTVEDMLVDNAAMQIVNNPAALDVLLTSNIFGDILSDEAAQITGSIGMLASSSLGDGTRGLYEPIHGSAPDIAGKDIANPVATILAAAMMLRDSFKLLNECAAIENAVESVLQEGWRTADIYEDGKNKVTGSRMACLIAERI